MAARVGVHYCEHRVLEGRGVIGWDGLLLDGWVAVSKGAPEGASDPKEGPIIFGRRMDRRIISLS